MCVPALTQLDVPRKSLQFNIQISSPRQPLRRLNVIADEIAFEVTGSIHVKALLFTHVGAADYIAISQNYHTIFIEDIPTMSMRISDKARRFITLVDELYNRHCCLICTAASSIDDLFLGADEGTLFDMESFQFETEIEETKLRRDVLSPGDVAPVASTNETRASIQSLLSGREEMFAFRRAVSRLIEMQTPGYLQGVRHHPRFQRLV